MLGAVVVRTSAWAPGIESAAAVRAWIENPQPLAATGHPDAKFLPAMLRRRCTPLTRIMLTAAHECCDNAAQEVRTVFASRHGSINESIGLLEAIAASGRLSAATFSHSVHNAQAGLFSIASSNRQASSSIAAQQDSFPTGFLEAMTHLQRDPDRPVLLVMGDVPLAEAFAPLVDEPAASYAVAMLLAKNGNGPHISLRIEPGEKSIASPPWPAAFQFLHWLASTDSELSIPTPGRIWRFSR